ncbi:MAE_28990/MAE_18760 family HEPN-like nuclease [Methanosarcina sp.]|uniref:MAE_28990/MAE_18760 family HEPN-like nuclease n=1 Tax=Methanosarcina sp. TaxID=2213 RepID=UPI002ABC66D8|nr:MAE_28990/MAE_18760 family HEPN-like nuclease [Methanosarcina sp.]MDY9924830.1 MAE_28990/MAE_18760 family HEPN-like nuclease [Methanosarcina sp.]
MNRLEQELLYEVDWRINELSVIRTIPVLCNCNPKQTQILERYSVVAIYSIWEGFVETGFGLYVREINSLNLTYNEIHLNILTHDVFIKFDLTDEQKKHFKNRCTFVDSIIEFSKLPVSISPILPTESNIGFDIINQILTHFCLDKLPSKEYEQRFKKLLHYRNNIAHGQFSLPVDRELINYLILTVIDAMSEVTIRIVEGFKNKKYLKEAPR